MVQFSENMISKGCKVRFDFRLSLADEDKEIDSTFGRKPADLVIGDGKLLPGIEAKLLGLKAGEKQSFTLSPEDGFGALNPENVHSFPRSQFDEDVALERGLVLSFSDAVKNERPGVVKSFDDQSVEIDFNHPLAGRILKFCVEIHRVESAE